ncbi:MAG: hypothetical protein AAGJ87_14035, partial [Pseudomonadota bacterium]
EGYRAPKPMLAAMSRYLTLEFLIVTGLALIIGALIGIMIIAAKWSALDYQALPSVLPVVFACASLMIGIQNIVAGFLIAIIVGHEADFMEPSRASLDEQPSPASAVNA